MTICPNIIFLTLPPILRKPHKASLLPQSKAGADKFRGYSSKKRPGQGTNSHGNSGKNCNGKGLCLAKASGTHWNCHGNSFGNIMYYNNRSYHNAQAYRSSKTRTYGKALGNYEARFPPAVNIPVLRRLESLLRVSYLDTASSSLPPQAWPALRQTLPQRPDLSSVSKCLRNKFKTYHRRHQPGGKFQYKTQETSVYTLNKKSRQASNTGSGNT